MKITRVLVTVMVLLCVGALVYAQRPLDRGTINRWADSMDEFERWSEAQGDLDSFDDDYDDYDDPMDFETAFAQAAREHAEIRRIISRHGFSDGTEWAQIGARIMRAYGAVEMGEQAPEYRSEMQRQLDELEDNPHFDDETRAMMRRQMEEAMGTMAQVWDAPEADVAAVRANRARLERLFED